MQFPTFEALVATIHDILTQEIDIRESNFLSFLAKDDLWGMEWRARTGFPMTTYREKWESLEIVPQSGYGNESLSASVRFSDTIHLPIPEAEFRIRRLAYDYLKSNPGHKDAAKSRVIHYACYRLLQRDTLPKQRLEQLAGGLKYRLNKIIARATDFKDRLATEFPDCRECDTTLYMARLPIDSPKRERFSSISSMVFDSKLFDEPEGHEGMPYAKGIFYLAIVLTECGWDHPKIEDAMEELVRVKNETSPLESTVRYFKFWENDELRGMVGTLAHSLGKRLRSRSPRK